jgi:hypothetical protein
MSLRLHFNMPCVIISIRFIARARKATRSLELESEFTKELRRGAI